MERLLQLLEETDKQMRTRRSPSLNPGVIGEDFLEEEVPELGPEVRTELGPEVRTELGPSW